MPPSALAQVHRRVAATPGATKPLSARLEALCQAWLTLSLAGVTPSHAEAGKAAGFRGINDNSIRVQVQNALNQPHVQARLLEMARAHINEGAPAISATLRLLGEKARSERVKADVAMRLGETLGILAPQQQGGGQAPAVQINVVFSDPIAATQWQAGTASAQVVEAQAVSATGHDLAKVGASAAAPQPAAKRAPKAAAKRKRGKKPKRGVGGAKRPRALAAGVSTRFSPVEVTEDVGPTDEGSGG